MPPAKGRRRSANGRRTTASKTGRKTTGKKRGRKPTFTEAQTTRIRKLAREEIEAALRTMFKAAGVARRSG